MPARASSASRQGEGRGGAQRLEHQGAAAEVAERAVRGLAAGEEDAAVLALPAPDHDERRLEAPGALLQDEGREHGLDDEVHVAPDEPLRQVVEVTRDHEVAHRHVRAGRGARGGGRPSPRKTLSMRSGSFGSSAITPRWTGPAPPGAARRAAWRGEQGGRNHGRERSGDAADGEATGDTGAIVGRATRARNRVGPPLVGSRASAYDVPKRAPGGRMGRSGGRGRLADLVALALGCAGCGSDGVPRPRRRPASPTPTASPPAASVPLPAAGQRGGPARRRLPDRRRARRGRRSTSTRPSGASRPRPAVTFRMRPGQTRPIVHFEPARAASGVALRLDGQDLDPARASDARFFSFEGSGQVSLELQRDLAPGASHRLEASYPLSLADAGGRFFADVNDLEGRGNEVGVPHPEHPARARAPRARLPRPRRRAVPRGRLRPRDRSRRPATSRSGSLDTEREVASYTVMFHLAPARTHLVSERRLRGVDVRVLAPDRRR